MNKPQIIKMDEQQTKILDFLKAVAGYITKELGGHVVFFEMPNTANFKIQWTGYQQKKGTRKEIYFMQLLSSDEIMETGFALDVANEFIKAYRAWEVSNG